MARTKDVGTSYRTPLKHRILRDHSGRDIGAAIYASKVLGIPYYGHLIVEHNAGDGIPIIPPGQKENWWQQCSPGIMANHAVYARKRNNPPIRIRLWELNPDVFLTLVENLDRHLPEGGFTQISNFVWVDDNGSSITAINGDSSQEDYSDLQVGEWLYVHHDPNNINRWCFSLEAFNRAINNNSRMGTFMSTLGCNSAGLKRLDYESRKPWFNHVRNCINALGHWQDIILAEIDRDTDQWAYLVMVPSKWSKETITTINKAFTKMDMKANIASVRFSPQDFNEICYRLFLTHREREEFKL